MSEETKDQKITRQVPAIESGTVIDHIPANVTMKIVEILGAGKKNLTTIGINLISKRVGKKGIIKISDTELSENQVNRIALIAPKATLNIIKDFKVKDKSLLEVPDRIEKLIKCNNPNCVTNNDKVPSKFDILKNEDDSGNENIRARCFYCERVMDKEDLELI